MVAVVQTRWHIDTEANETLLIDNVLVLVYFVQTLGYFNSYNLLFVVDWLAIGPLYTNLSNVRRRRRKVFGDLTYYYLLISTLTWHGSPGL